MTGRYCYTKNIWCKEPHIVPMKRNCSVGRCVSLRAFLVKVANIHILVEKYILLKKKDVFNFFLHF